MPVSIKSSVQICKSIFTYMRMHVSYHSLRSWNCTQPQLPGLAIESTLATGSSIRWARFTMPTFGSTVKWPSFHTVSLKRAQPGTSRVPPPTHGCIIPPAKHTRARVAWHPWAASLICTCMCVCVCICIHVCIYVYVYVYVCIYMCMHVCVCMCTCICVYVYVYIQVHMYFCGGSACIYRCCCAPCMCRCVR